MLKWIETSTGYFEINIFYNDSTITAVFRELTSDNIEFIARSSLKQASPNLFFSVSIMTSDLNTVIDLDDTGSTLNQNFIQSYSNVKYDSGPTDDLSSTSRSRSSQVRLHECHCPFDLQKLSIFRNNVKVVLWNSFLGKILTDV